MKNKIIFKKIINNKNSQNKIIFKKIINNKN